MIKKWIGISGIVLLIGACTFSDNSGGASEYKAATGDGAMRVRLDEIRDRVRQNQNNEASYRSYRLDSVDRHNFDSEYPFWESLVLYSNEKELRMANLLGEDSGFKRLEEFHFGKDGELEYAQLRQQAERDSSQFEFYFIKEKLILAKENGQEINIEDDTTKYKSILLIKEADRLQKLAASKKVKP